MPHLDKTQLEDKLVELRMSQQTIQEHQPHNHSQQQQPQPQQPQQQTQYNNLCSISEPERAKSSPQPAQEIQSCNMSQGSGLGRPALEPPLSPISETPPPIRSRASSSGTNTRSVSAAVSDESVAGDSGVFEASNRRRLSGIHGADILGQNDLTLETAQIQIKLRYDSLRLTTMELKNNVKKINLIICVF